MKKDYKKKAFERYENLSKEEKCLIILIRNYYFKK